MRIPTLVTIAVAWSCFAGAVNAEVSNATVAQRERVFRQLSEEQVASVDAERALVMGNYVLDSASTEQLQASDTLSKAIDRIRTTDWKAGAWTEQNAELTIRQRMNDYVQTAHQFYRGEGKRPMGELGRRLEKFTDVELGDRQLASALMAVQMATAWDVPIEASQIERLDDVIRVRLAQMNRQINEYGSMR